MTATEEHSENTVSSPNQVLPAHDDQRHLSKGRFRERRDTFRHVHPAWSRPDSASFDIYAALHGVLSGRPMSEILQLLHHLEKRQFAAGDIILEQDKNSGCSFFLLEGALPVQLTRARSGGA